MASRVAYKPITLPQGVEVKVDGQVAKIKGSKGELVQPLHKAISLNISDSQVLVQVDSTQLDKPDAMAGTTRALVQNHVTGVSQGFTKKLQLVGVGYRAQVGKQGNLSKVELTLGLSHPVVYVAPEGITLSSSAVTEVEVSGIDKQVVGQVAAEIRSFRLPEPYKGKGIRYADEVIQLKETKK
ncbi:MAG: 50S ribosomal protein L6 [Legionellales bacterium]|nr:50S ribosomal protein L6 [Legionellales bacterium]